MTFTTLFVTLLVVGVAYAQFLPGCSFTAGQCLYNVKIGHHSQCNILEGQVTLNSGTQNLVCYLSSTSEQQMASERQTEHLLHTIAQYETEFNNSQTELTTVLGQAGAEIRTLRSSVTRLTSTIDHLNSALNTCRATHPTGPTIPPADVGLTFCDFETLFGRDRTCGYTNQSYSYTFRRAFGKINDSTGPIEDHTMTSPSGHYMIFDVHNISLKSLYSSVKVAGLTSPEFSPSPNACLRFWYNMFGEDVQDFNVYVQVSGGNGYPVFHRKGNGGQVWSLAEVDLDKEYTSHPFSLVFEGTTTAYHQDADYYHGRQFLQLNNRGDIAFDDVYLYNASCKSVPVCPANGNARVTWDIGNTTYCYTFHTQSASWYEAASLCRQQGATSYLVTVTSQFEQDFLVQTIKNDIGLSAAGQYGYYAGYNDERSEHTFDWTDTGVPYQGTYSNWKVGQPNDVGSNEDCLLLQFPDLDYQWGDVDCNERHPFICKTAYPKDTAAAVAQTAGANILIG